MRQLMFDHVWLFVPLCLAWITQLAAGKTLRPIRNTTPELLNELQLGKRSINSVFDLQSHEEFLWGDDDDADESLGRLSVHMTDEYENILNAEKFWPLLRSLECKDDGLELAFNDDATFARAKEIWDWANGEDDRYFIMVIGAGDCGWNDERQPYLVRALEYDEEGNVARLVGEPRDWLDVAHSYDFDIGGLAEDRLDDYKDRDSDVQHDSDESISEWMVKRNTQGESRDSFITDVLDLDESESESENGSESQNESNSDGEDSAKNDSDWDVAGSSTVEGDGITEAGINSGNDEESRSDVDSDLRCGDRLISFFSDGSADDPGDDFEVSSEGEIEGLPDVEDETINNSGERTRRSLVRRKIDMSKATSIPFGTNFPVAVEFKNKLRRYGTKLRCMYCGTRGRFDIRYRIQRKNWVPTAIRMTLNPRGVEFYMGLKWHLFGLMTPGDMKLKKKSTLATLPLPGSLNIPKLFEIGPRLEVNWAVGLADLKGQTVMIGGMNTTIPDDSVLELDLLHPSRNRLKQWAPEIKPLDFRIESRLSAKAETYIGLAFSIPTKIMGQGYELELEWRAAHINGKVEYVQSDKGVCQTRQTKGVKYSFNWGTNLVLNLKEPHDPKLLGGSDELYELKLGSRDFPCRPQCKPLQSPLVGGLPLNDDMPSGDPLPIDIPVDDPTDQVFSGLPCSISDNTKNGTCLPTSNCLKAGGVFERDGCSGPDHIQCCYVPDPCRQYNGAIGQCIATSMCADNGGYSEPGHCPGPSMIQCCTS